ncbi:oligosaccharide flippase family protein [Vibrio cholerae]|uniref:lipopolysaccharide biosynthesis protein n=1 Tax=Vibrio cholerae TaxID=666 RepID=UPI00215C3C5B|nr:oligosaccharide flippase family protein [Vibrio cholerae]MCR9872834.1 oligosaccharide flippase family protein [Vibrio cholerae]
MKLNLIKESSVYITSNIIVTAIPLLFLPLLTRFLEPEEYNAIAMFQSLMLTCGALLGFSVNGFCNIKYFEVKEDLAEFSFYVTNAIFVLFVSTVFAISISILASFTEVVIWGLTPRDYLLIPLAFFCQYIVYIRLGVYQVTKKSLKYGGVSFALAAINMSTTAILVIYLESGYFGRIAGIVFSLACISCFCLVSLYKEKLIVRKLNILNLKEITRYGLTYLPIIFASTFIPLTERIIITSELGADSGGLFIVATQVSNGLLLIISSIAVAYTPYVYKRLSNTDRIDLAKKIFTYEILAVVLLTVFSLVILYSGIPKAVLSYILPENYYDAIDLSVYLIFSVVGKTGFVIWSIYLVFWKKNTILSLFNIFVGAVNLILIYFFIQKYGIGYIGYLSIFFKFTSSVFIAGLVFLFLCRIDFRSNSKC